MIFSLPIDLPEPPRHNHHGSFILSKEECLEWNRKISDFWKRRGLTDEINDYFRRGATAIQ